MLASSLWDREPRNFIPRKSYEFLGTASIVVVRDLETRAKVSNHDLGIMN